MIWRRSVVVILLVSVWLIPRPAEAKVRWSERWLFEAINTERVHRSIRSLTLDESLCDTVRSHSKQMAMRGKLFHTVDPVSRYLTGKKWRTWGENVGVSAGDIGSMFRTFMASSAHKRNFLNPAFSRVAIGVYTDGRGWLWVTVFLWG